MNKNILLLTKRQELTKNILLKVAAKRELRDGEGPIPRDVTLRQENGPNGYNWEEPLSLCY